MKESDYIAQWVWFFINVMPRYSQIKLLKALCENKRVAVRWCRQIGKTTVLGWYCLFKCLTHKNMSIIVVAPGLRQSMGFFQRIRDIVDVNESLSCMVIRKTQTEILFRNGSKISCLPCVAPGTKIITENGLKNIEKIEIGEKVLTHENRFRTVSMVHETPVKCNLYKLKHKTHKSQGITVTGKHPFWTNKGWLSVKQIYEMNESERNQVRFKGIRKGLHCRIHRRRRMFWNENSTHKSKNNTSKTLHTSKSKQRCRRGIVKNKRKDRWLYGSSTFKRLYFSVKYRKQKSIESGDTGAVALFNSQEESGRNSSASLFLLPEHSIPRLKIRGLDKNSKLERTVNSRKFKEQTREKERWIGQGELFKNYNIERIDYKGNVYNLTVDEDNSYCSDEFVLHNCGPTGATIAGKTGQIVVMEEAGYMKSMIVNRIVMPFIASYGDEGQAIKIGTPFNKGHFHSSCNSDKYYESHVDYRQAIKEGALSQTFIDEMQEECTELEFRTEWEAEFIEDADCYFKTDTILNAISEYPMISDIYD